MAGYHCELWLRQSVISELTEALNGKGYTEICGVLAGTVHNGISSAEFIITLPNTDSRPGWFGILDSDFDRAKRFVQRQHMLLVAVFHSHVTGNLDLSLPDKAALRESDLPWLVCTYDPSSSTLTMRAYAARGCKRMPIRVLKPG